MTLKRLTSRLGWVAFGTAYVVMAGLGVACVVVAVDVCQKVAEVIDEWGKG